MRRKKTTEKPDPQAISEEVRKTRNKAEEYARNPEKAKELLEAALKKSQGYDKNKGPLAEVWTYLMALFRLLQAYISRDYVDIPWGSIVMIIGAIIYFVSPVDLIPDFLPVAGMIDDAAVVGFVVIQVKTDLDNFLAWEASRPTTE
jgi:uncharacterized membrane protein YkvA (DUF1232 family)